MNSTHFRNFLIFISYVQSRKKQPNTSGGQPPREKHSHEQIAQMLENEELSYHSLDVLINDFLFVYTNKDQNYEKVLDVVFMNYFKSRPYFTMYDMDEQQMHEAYHFFTMLCRNRKLLVQIATDKGIINPKN